MKVKLLIISVKVKLLMIILSFFYSCDLVNIEENIPSIINIESIELQGNHTSNITDAWVYIDNEFQGVYPLPANFPILKTGNQKITIEAGIKKNGISSSRVNYNYFTSYKLDTVLIENKSIKLYPKVNYSLTNFPYNENFEGIGSSLKVISDSLNHSLIKIYDSSNNKFGNYYVKSEISGEFGELFECNTNNFNLPKNQVIYLEMDYKCNSTFIIGIYAKNNSTEIKTPIIYLNKKDNWNKIYISLTETIANYNEANEFKIFFALPRDTSLAHNEMYLDNIRLLYEK